MQIDKNNQKSPLVSVIVAAYNAEKYLEAAIESIYRQTYSQIEIVVIDDGSTDKTQKIIQRYTKSLYYFFQENRGQPAAQNYGISQARGTYITFLDSDDIYLPNKIASQVAILENNRDIDCVFGYMQNFVSEDIACEQREGKEEVPGYVASGGLFRRKCFELVGNFDESLRLGIFIDWYMRAEEMGIKHILNRETVVLRRIHNNNMTANADNARMQYLYVIKSAWKRRKNESLSK